WHKKEGDHVAKGEVLFEVETDKANMEIESPASGILRRILVAAGTSVPVTTLVALLSDTADEPIAEAAPLRPLTASASAALRRRESGRRSSASTSTRSGAPARAAASASRTSRRRPPRRRPPPRSRPRARPHA